MSLRNWSFLLAFVPLLALGQANDGCANAALLCAEQFSIGNNTGATTDGGFCGADVLNDIWYTFTTNSVGGVVHVEVSDLNCPAIAGMDNELSVVVLSGNGSCQAGSFGIVGACQEDSVDFDLTTNALAANTQYWVVIGGVMDGGAALPAECGFQIVVSGPGVDVVGLDFYAGPDVIISEGSATQLSVTGGTTYLWTPTSGLSGNTVASPFAQPSETTTYTVQTQINGCTFTDEVVVEVRRLIDPPNTITPNGDGKNDTWEIYGIGAYPQAQVSIYDRWGQRVYFSVGYDQPFDGGGLPTATYYWVIDLNILQGVSDPYTGFLTIVN